MDQIGERVNVDARSSGLTVKPPDSEVASRVSSLLHLEQPRFGHRDARRLGHECIGALDGSHLTSDHVATLATFDEIVHVEDPDAAGGKLTSMLAHARISCIDGRDERCVVGAPGGDGGEFLLVLAAI